METPGQGSLTMAWRLHPAWFLPNTPWVALLGDLALRIPSTSPITQTGGQTLN